MSKQTLKEEEKQKAITFLRDEIGLKVGSKIGCVVLHVSRSGMQRTIKTLVSHEDEVFDISPWVARATDSTFDRDRGGIKIGGCGMDMGWAIVFQLGHALYPNGFECIGEGCPSCDHSNGDRDRAPHHHKNGEYSLRKEWV